jgi:hypothetical protein
MSNFVNAPDLDDSDYIVLGVATCFVKVDGEVSTVKVLEPIPSAALEALFKSIPTSYDFAYATEIGKILNATGELTIPSGVFADGFEIASEFYQRAIATTRTYKAKPEAQKHIAKGSSYSNFNFSLEKKRVLNSDRSVSEEDNVKQHSHTHKVL